MKKLLLAIALLLSTATFACHIDPLGWCTGKSFFVLLEAQNSEFVEIQYQPFGTSIWVDGTVITTATNGSTTAIVSFSQPSQNEPISVRFRTRLDVNNAWSDWYNPTIALTTAYAACSALPVKFTYFKVTSISNNIYRVDFTAAEAENVREFRITFSLDGISFKTVHIITPQGLTPNKNYSTIINLN